MQLVLEGVCKTVGAARSTCTPSTCPCARGRSTWSWGPPWPARPSLLRILAGLDRPSGGRLLERRAGPDRPARAQAGRGHGLPAVHQLPLADRVREHRLAPAQRRAAGGGDPAAGGGHGRGAPAEPLARPPPGRAVGRPAAAHGPGPGAGQGRRPAAAGRAAVQPGLQAARGAAGRAGRPARRPAPRRWCTPPPSRSRPCSSAATPSSCTRAVCCSRGRPSRCSPAPPPWRWRRPSPTPRSTSCRHSGARAGRRRPPRGRGQRPAAAPAGGDPGHAGRGGPAAELTLAIRPHQLRLQRRSEGIR